MMMREVAQQSCSPLEKRNRKGIKKICIGVSDDASVRPGGVKEGSRAKRIMDMWKSRSSMWNGVGFRSRGRVCNCEGQRRIYLGWRLLEDDDGC